MAMYKQIAQKVPKLSTSCPNFPPKQGKIRGQSFLQPKHSKIWHSELTNPVKQGCQRKKLLYKHMG